MGFPITTIGATEQADQPEAQAPPPQTLNDAQLAALTRLAANREQLDPDTRATVEEVAKKYKIPLAPQQGFSTLPNPGKENIDSMKSAVLPMAGQLVGALGANMISPGNAPLTAAMQGAGGALGVKGNDLLGISKPDEIDYALSAGAPLLGTIAGKYGRRLLPGSAAAEQQIGAEILKKTPDALAGSKQAVDAAYAKVTQTPLPVPNFTAKVGELLTTEQGLKKYGVSSAPIRGAMTKTADTLAQNPQGIPLTEVNGLLKRYREKVASLEGKGGEQYGAYKALRGSIFEDMNQAITTAGKAGQDTTLLKQAMGEAKLKIGRDEYIEILDKYGTKMEALHGEVFETIDPVRVLNKLKQIDLAATIGVQQATKIEGMLKELAKIPHPTGELRSGLGQAGRVAAAGGVGAATAVIGTPLAGAGAAVAAYGGMQVHSALAALSMSDTGRKYLVKLFKHNKGRIGERTSQMIQFAASQLEDQP